MPLEHLMESLTEDITKQWVVSIRKISTCVGLSRTFNSPKRQIFVNLCVTWTFLVSTLHKLLRWVQIWSRIRDPGDILSVKMPKIVQSAQNWPSCEHFWSLTRLSQKSRLDSTRQFAESSWLTVHHYVCRDWKEVPRPGWGRSSCAWVEPGWA